MSELWISVFALVALLILQLSSFFTAVLSRLNTLFLFIDVLVISKKIAKENGKKYNGDFAITE